MEKEEYLKIMRSYRNKCQHTDYGDITSKISTPHSRSYCHLKMLQTFFFNAFSFVLIFIKYDLQWRVLSNDRKQIEN